MLTKKEISHFSEQMPEGTKVVALDAPPRGLADYSLWDFISQFHPNYFHCTSVTYSDDLQCVVDKEYFEEDSGAEAAYFEIADTLGVSRDKEDEEATGKILAYAAKELIEVNADCMERAIEGFISYMKGGK